MSGKRNRLACGETGCLGVGLISPIEFSLVAELKLPQVKLLIPVVGGVPFWGSAIRSRAISGFKFIASFGRQPTTPLEVRL